MMFIPCFTLYDAAHANAERERKQREEQFQAHMRMQQALANGRCEQVTHENYLQSKHDHI